jgi:Protein of unknown function (DUF2877)
MIPPGFLGRGITALAAGRVRDAVHAHAGLGEGLTPAGDDVLAGYAAARGALGALGAPEGVALNGSVPLSTLAAERSSALGLAYLRCAQRGELPDAGAQLLVAIRCGSVGAVQARSREFLLGVHRRASRSPRAWPLRSEARCRSTAWG